MKNIKIGTANGLSVYYWDGVVYIARTSIHLYNVKNIEDAVERARRNFRGFRAAENIEKK